MCSKRMKRIHLCLDIEGGISNAAELRGCIKVDGKTLDTVKEVREFLKAQLAMGRKYLPYGECDNFDYQTGCKGHIIEGGDTDVRKTEIGEGIS